MAPPATALTLHERDRIAVVAPHPDDDVLGCSALLVAAATRSLPIAIVYVTDGSRSHPGSQRFPAQRLRILREREALAALARCGVEPMAATFLRARDGACETLSLADRRTLCERLAHTLVAFAPTLVFAPWSRDPHPDHRAVAAFVASAIELARAHVDRMPRVVAYTIWLDERGIALDRPTPGEARSLAFAFGAKTAARKRAAIAAHRSQTGALVDDDPSAFALPQAMIERACASPETFLEVCDA